MIFLLDLLLGSRFSVDMCQKHSRNNRMKRITTC